MNIVVIHEQNREAFAALEAPQIIENSLIAFGAVQDGKACGIVSLLYEEELHAVTIDYLYVKEAYRRKGVADALLDKVEEFAYVARTESVECQFLGDTQMQPFCELLEHRGYARDKGGGVLYAFTVRDLQEKFFQDHIKGLSGRVDSLENITNRMWNTFVMRLEKEGSAMDFVPILRSKEEYDRTCSFVYVVDQEICGCILLRQEKDEYVLEYLCSLHHTSPLAMMGLLQASYRVLVKRTHEDKVIHTHAVNEKAQHLLQKICRGGLEPLGELVTYYKVETDILH